MLLPTREEISLAAYYRWQARGEGQGHDLFDWHEARHDLVLRKNYRSVCHYRLAGTKTLTLGSKDPRRCRFCDRERLPHEKSNPFKNEAHAVPCLLGNESLLSHEECNDCNERFSRLESDLAAFINPARTLMGIGGRGGVPRFKDRNLRIERTGNHTEIAQKEGEPVVRFDDANSEAHMTLTVGAFTPIALYKCFTKMALSVMPAADLSSYRRARDWVRCTDHTRHLECFAGHGGYFFFIPGPPYFEYPWVKLLRRRDDGAHAPHMIFLAGSANIMFMTMLPLSSKDDFLDGKRFTFPRTGLPVGPGYPFGPATVTRIPMSSADRVRGLRHTVTFHVDSYQWVKGRPD